MNELSGPTYLSDVIDQMFNSPSPQVLAFQDDAKVDEVTETKRDNELDDLLEEYSDAVDEANELERAVDQARKSDRLGPRDALGEAVKKRVELAKKLRDALDRDRKIEAELRKLAEKGGEGSADSRTKQLRVARRIRRIKDALQGGAKAP